MAVDMLTLSILVVDDSPVITEMVKDAFENEGYKVQVANDGAEALSMALESHPDLIIADITMPGMDGWELCSQIRSNPFTSFIPFIFLTSRTETPDRIRGLQMGADDYLTKPFEMDELLARVQLIFQRIRKTQETMILSDKKTLSGSTSEMSLPDLLQMFGLNNKTGLLRITRVGYPTGTIAMESGRIMNARLGKHSGEKALFRLLGWKDANFDVQPLMDKTPDEGLDISIEEALMEGMRQLDEATEMEKDMGLSGKKLEITSPPDRSDLSPREEELFTAIKKEKEMNALLDALPWSDFDIYKKVAYWIRKGAITVS